MICRKYINFGDVAVTTSWGSMYETAEPLDCGDYAQPFVSDPDVSIMPMNTFFVEKKHNTTTKTSWGSFWVCRGASYDKYLAKVSCIAIGRWKAEEE